MRIQNSFAAAVAAAVAAVVFSAAFQPAEAGVMTFYFQQVGSNVIRTGSGNFTTSGLTPTITGFHRYNGSTGSQFLNSGSTPFINTNQYIGIFTPPTTGNNVSGVGSTVSPSTNSGDGFFFNSQTGSVYLPLGYVSDAAINNVATYNGTNLDTTFGYSMLGTPASPVLERTYTLEGGNTILVYSVPEPSQVLLVAGAGVSFGIWRLRKTRRHTAANEATEC